VTVAIPLSSLIAGQDVADPTHRGSGGFPGKVLRAGGGGGLSYVLLLSGAAEPAAEILPSLSLLPHAVRVAPADAESVIGSAGVTAVLVDARRDLVRVRQFLRLLRSMGIGPPVIAIVTEGGWAAVTADWGADEVILHTAGPGEVEARLRLAAGRAAPAASGEIRSGDLVIDEPSYSARLRGRVLDLTFKEFELLKFLAQNPARAFTRSQLLQEVWGYDYFGGTRTVDVHVRRLRAKLGAEHESLIGTVRNVGYRFVPAKTEEQGRNEADGGPVPAAVAAVDGISVPGTASREARPAHAER
jgi:DNA-binding response OmpR family regulator